MIMVLTGTRGRAPLKGPRTEYHAETEYRTYGVGIDDSSETQTMRHD